jgi:hypothetical protein
MTPAIVEAVNKYNTRHLSRRDEETSLDSPKEGNPISHAQLIDISKMLRGKNEDIHLDQLLKGCAIYQNPKSTPKQKSTEYEQLMARLRKEDEARQYERMLHPESIQHQNTTYGHMLNHNQNIAASQEDDLTYKEINRQIGLIFNVLVSIIACGIAIWIAARRWSAPPRLALSMAGSLIVGIAEVVVYTGYLRRLNEAKVMEKKKKEVVSIHDSWVIEPTSKSSATKSKKESKFSGLRSRIISEKPTNT